MALFAFCPLLFFPYVYDDTVIILTNHYLGSFSSFGELWKGHVDSSHVMDGAYRPLFLSFLSIIKATLGSSPAIYRFISLAIHSFSTWLIFRLAQETFGLKRPLALGISFLFLLHPIHLTTLDLVWKQSSLWLAFLALSSLYFLFKQRLWSCLFLMIVGLLVKENALIFPLLWLAMEPLLPKQNRKYRLFLVSVALLLGFVYYFWVWPLFPRPIDSGGTPSDRLKYFATQLSVFPYYLKALLYPAHLTIDRNIVFAESVSLSSVMTLLVLIFGGVLAWVIALRKHSPKIVALLLALIWLAPTSTLHPLALSYDETRLYLFFAFALISGALFLQNQNLSIPLRPSLKQALTRLFFIVLFLLSFVGSFRFSSEKTLWKEALRVDPKSARAHYQLGVLSEKDRALDEAEDHYRKALLFSPDFPGAILGLGLIQGKKGDLEGAEREFRKLLAHGPYWKTTAHYHLGLNAMYKNEKEISFRHLQEVRAFPPLIRLAERGEVLSDIHFKKFRAARGRLNKMLKRSITSEKDRKWAQEQLTKLAPKNTLR